MKIEQVLLIFIMLIVVVLGFVGILWIAFGGSPACPTGAVLRDGVCCQDYNNDGYCDIASGVQQGATGMTIQVETGPSEDDLLLERLNSALAQLEEKTAQMNRPGYTCDEWGCRKQSNMYYYNDYYYDYGYDRYDGRNSDEEWDLKIIVEDDETGEPIEDARVLVENGDDERDYTDEDGEVKFRNLEEDCYDIKVEASGYFDEDDYTCLTRDKTIRIYLEPRD